MPSHRADGESFNYGTASVTEFGTVGDADVAEASINGRYPEHGFAVNRKSDMLIRAISGSGHLVLREDSHKLQPGDVIHIEKETQYYYEGDNLCVMLICSPPWDKEQYEIVD